MKRASHRSIKARFGTPEKSPRLRIICETVGPGKAELLELIGKTRSISEAARRMKMSYLRAWEMVDALNAAFKLPLVASTPGGRQGGGSTLTSTGKRVLQHYRRIYARSFAASRADLFKLHRLLKR